MKIKSGFYWFVLFCWSLVGAAPLESATVTIDIAGFAFVPAAKTINAGDTVMWMNSDTVAHTSTSGSGGVADGFWDSGVLSPDQSFSHAFPSAGTFPYYCGLHTFMTGTITVQGVGGGGPTVAITNPTNNTVIAAPGNVTIEASASASGASITMVEFFDGAVSMGTDTTDPYSIVANLGAGQHSLTAKATDSAGASAVSAAIAVTVGGGGTKIDDPIPTPIAKGNITIELQTVVEGLVSPLGLATPDDGSGRLFLYDQIGLIHIISNGTKMETPLLDVRGRLVSLDAGYDERGLLGVATHPNFATHPFIYTYTSEPNGPMADFMIMPEAPKTNDHQSVIAEWRIDPANTNRVDPASRREIMRIDKPQSNHNGGTMRFGPDGFLYFTVGDGGAADDQGEGHSPGGNGQDRSKILGKVSRIDVDARTSANGQYGIPTDNPFVGQAGVVAEIYAWGLRNPYSFSFDRQNGDLLLADVGQNDVEEVDKIVKGGNFGWNIKEGSFYFNPNGTNDGFVTTAPVREVPPDLIDPIAEFDHDEGDAVIGGYVSRGPILASLSGKYIFGSWGEFAGPEGRLFFLDGVDIKELRIGLDDRKLGLWLKGFGEDAAGDLYIFGSTNLGPSGTSGKMMKIVAAVKPPLENSYIVQNLVSDVPGMAPVIDANLANPWGIAFGPTTFFWVSDNHTGVSTLYNSTGGVQSLVVKIPVPTAIQPPAAPTGVVFNNTTDFEVGGAPARFIFVTENGTVAAWNSGSGTNAVLAVDNSASGAIYKGVAIGSTGGSNLLYAADFHGATIDVFDTNFQAVSMTESFSDPTIPAGFAAFNIENIGGNLYVTYAKQDDEKEDDIPGLGNGFVNVFQPDGKLVKRFASNGTLNSPWAVTMAPASFGAFGGALLIGNFGDGRINAFDPITAEFLGQLNTPFATPISIEGLWDIKFGNGTQAGDPKVAYFTAGISGGGAIEDHGLFGSITFTPAFVITETIRAGNNLTITWRGGTPPYRVQMRSDLSTGTWTDGPTVTDTTATVPIEGAAGFFRIFSAANSP